MTSNRDCNETVFERHYTKLYKQLQVEKVNTCIQIYRVSLQLFSLKLLKSFLDFTFSTPNYVQDNFYVHRKNETKKLSMLEKPFQQTTL